MGTITPSDFLRRHGLLGIAIVCCVCTFLLAFRSLAQAHADAVGAARSHDNTVRCQEVASRLAQLRPQLMPANGQQLLVKHLKTALQTAGIDERDLQDLSAQSLGPLTGLSAGRQQTHMELSKLTLTQLIMIVDALESSGLPCWIETMTLTADGASSDRWHLSVDVQWLNLLTTLTGDRSVASKGI